MVDLGEVSPGPNPRLEGVQLEGWMLKRGSRRRKQWNRRYFTLSDNTFSYREDPSDDKPKASYTISAESGCEVSGMYIDQRNDGGKKELLYCVKIAWSSENRREGGDHKSSQEVVSGGQARSRPLSPDETPVAGTPGTMTPVRKSRSMTGSPPQRNRRQSAESLDVGAEVTDLAVSASIKKAKHARSKSLATAKSKPPLKQMPHREEDVGDFNSFRSEIVFPTDYGFPSKPERVFRSQSDQIPGDDGNVISGGKTVHKSRSFVSFGRSRKQRTVRPGEDFECFSVVSSPEIPNLARTPRRTSRNLDLSTPGETEKSRQVAIKRVDSGITQSQLVNDSFRAEHDEERRLMMSLYEATKLANKRKTRKKIVSGGKIAAAAGAAITVGAMTAGVGLLAGMIVLGVGAAAGSTGVAAGRGLSQTRKSKDGIVVLASPDYDMTRKWKSALDACLVLETAKDTTWGLMFAREGRNTSSALLPSGAGLLTAKSLDTDDGSVVSVARGKYKVNEEIKQMFVNPESLWRPVGGGWLTLIGTGTHGIRVFREERSQTKSGSNSYLSFEGRPCPPLKAQIVLNASSLDSFMCLLSLSRIPSDLDLKVPLVPKSGQRASFRVIEAIDDHMDVIHLFFHPLYLFPSWTSPRDFVLLRYWRLEPDGTYFICVDSVEHDDCPPHPGYTRGEMHSVYTISPPKKHGFHQEKVRGNQCLLTAMVQVDPRGWVPTVSLPMLSGQSYAEAFGVAALLQLLDVRDAIDFDRFVPFTLGPESSMEKPSQDESLHLKIAQEKELRAVAIQTTSSQDMGSDDEAEDPTSYDYTYSSRESITVVDSVRGIAMNPKPLPFEKWAQPDANSFRVRGKFYKRDKKKMNAGSSIGRLVAVDIVRVERAIYSGFSLHPTERIQRALEREKKLKGKGLESDLPPFIFLVNIVIPGPPFFHMVFFYAIDDMSTIDGSDGSPSSKLCNQFFFGGSDKFRDETFKLIPSIVEGNFLVRKAVGTTPTIMGNKLRQLYVRRERFCEVILDCGSSSVAAGVVRLTLGYAKTLVVDMGFLFEGNDERTLPERIFGCVRIKKLHFGNHLRFVPQPEDVVSRRN